MKNIVYRRINESTKPIIGNPFVLCSCENKLVRGGQIEIINTGIKIDLEEDMIFYVLNKKKEKLVIVNLINDNGELKLAVTIEKENNIAESMSQAISGISLTVQNIELGDELAVIKLVNLNGDNNIRFLDMTDEKRNIYGDAEKTQ